MSANQIWSVTYVYISCSVCFCKDDVDILFHSYLSFSSLLFKQNCVCLLLLVRQRNLCVCVCVCVRARDAHP